MKSRLFSSLSLLLSSSLFSAMAAALTVAFSAFPLSAQAGLFDDDEARRAILDLRVKIEEMQRDVNARLDGKADKASALELANQNEQLQQEIAKLRGQLEIVSNDLANTQQRQKDFYLALDRRLQMLEPKKVTVDGKEAEVDPAEQKAYDAALVAFKAGDYKEASVLMADFVARYPQSAYATSVQYWLGSAYYAQRDYRNALAAQQTLIKNDPSHPKAPDALLNIASCYIELKDKAAAKKTLETLLAKYPNSAVAQTAKERLGALR